MCRPGGQPPEVAARKWLRRQIFINHKFMVKAVQTGLDQLVAERCKRLQGLRVGLVAHPASVDADLRHAADLIGGAPGVRLAAVFGPEHGWRGQAQDLEPVTSGQAEPPERRRPRVISLYGDTVDSLRPTAKQLDGLDVLVVDLQDIGSRYYTFQATMLYCLEAAQAAGLRVMILDRPNPLGGRCGRGLKVLWDRTISPRGTG